MSQKRVLLSVFHGAEELELMAPVDLLRRAGASVTLASTSSSLQILTSRKVCLQADSLLSSLPWDCWDMVVLPGGPGSRSQLECASLLAVLQHHVAAHKWIAAICASPVTVLHHCGLLKDVRATCYPALAPQLPGASHQRVVRDRNFITSQGPGTAVEFALALVKALLGKDKAMEIAQQIVFECNSKLVDNL
jgi:protein deglycase